MHRIITLAIALTAVANSGFAAEIAGQRLVLPAHERQVDVVYFRAPGEGPRPAAPGPNAAGRSSDCAQSQPAR